MIPKSYIKSSITSFLFLLLVYPEFSKSQIIREQQNDVKPVKQKGYGKNFFDKDSIHIIRITFIQCNYWDSLVYYRKIFDSLNVSNFMQASVMVDDKVYHSCGIRFKGESSYEFYPGKKKPFRIKFFFK